SSPAGAGCDRGGQGSARKPPSKGCRAGAAVRASAGIRLIRGEPRGGIGDPARPDRIGAVGAPTREPGGCAHPPRRGGGGGGGTPTGERGGGAPARGGGGGGGGGTRRPVRAPPGQRSA